MKVKELIKELKKMPPEARVFHIWDGEPRTAINVVYESKSGHVMTCDWGGMVYRDDYNPKDSDLGSFKYGRFHAPENPKGYSEEDELYY